MQKYILLVSLICMGLTLQAQEAVRQTVKTFSVGNWDAAAEAYAEIPVDTETQNWISLQAKVFFPDATNSSELSWEGSTIQMAADRSWNLICWWQQGDTRISLRFELWQKDNTLLLPEVGAYQACRCEGCTAVDFGSEPMRCICDDGPDCNYLMGETLH